MKTCVFFYLFIFTLYRQSLTRDVSATAILTLADAEEPFNGDVQYCCITPGKPCCPMSSLSGGEKTLASLALLFALRR